MWLWVFTKDDSKAAASAFGAVFFIGVAIHYYFLLCLAPFGILALAQRRFFHPKVVAAAAGVMGSLALLYPADRKFARRRAGIGSWTLPSLASLQSVYLEFFPVAIVPLALTAVGVAVFGCREHGVIL